MRSGSPRVRAVGAATCLVAALLSATPTASAGDDPCAAGSAPPCPPPPCAPCDPCRRLEVRIDATAEWKGEADLEGDRGDLSAYLAKIDTDLRMPLSRRLTWFGGVEVERYLYDLSDPDAVVPGTGRLIEDATRLYAETALEFPVSSRLDLRLGALVAYQGVPGAEFEDALTWGGLGSVRFPVGNGRLRIGASVETRLEGTLSVTPIIAYDGLWKGAWSIEARGNSVLVSRSIGRCLRLGIGGRYDRRDWRLSEDDRVPGGVFRDVRFAGGAFAAWRFSRCASLDVAAWYDFDHEVRIRDRDGDRVTTLDADPSVSLALTLTVEF